MGEQKPESPGKPASWGLLGVGMAKLTDKHSTAASLM